MQHQDRILKKRLLRLLAVVSLATTSLLATWFLVQAHSAPSVIDLGDVVGENDRLHAWPPLQASQPLTVYLPLVGRNFPPPPPQFGVQMAAINVSHGLTLAADGGVYWVRFSAFHWDKVEPVRTNPPTYDWSKVDEDSLRNAADNGMQVIATIQFTPQWAQKVSGAYCGPIKEDALDEFAQFLAELVNRYSASPYNVRYWELGNEPDIDPSLVLPRSGFGCWGDEADSYYGGGYYADMLKVAYPAIKASDPQAQVLIGGVLLDCDPTDPPVGKDCKPAKFLEGILRNGGGSYFDIVSFHGYPPYDGSLQQDEHFEGWVSRGGVVLGKVDFLRQVMASYGVDKPLMHTEGSLICPEWNTGQCNPPGSAFYEAQADYVVWLFVRNWAADLLGTTWFQFEGPGWRYSGMLDENQNPKLAYYALHFLTEELGNASYKGPVTQYSALRGYEFSAPGKRIWVLWAPDEQSHAVTLPSATLGVYDKYGSVITTGGSTMSVNSPIYVELLP